MELVEAVRRRRSTARITDQAPTDEQLRSYLAISAHAPDHGSLRPWRMVTVRGDDRVALGQALAAGFGDSPGTPEAARTAAKPLRAPLLLAVVATPTPHPKVPEWEQLAAVTALVITLELVLFNAGWTAFWRSGPACQLSEVHALTGIKPGEQLMGWLYIGGTAVDAGELADPDPDVADRLVHPPR